MGFPKIDQLVEVDKHQHQESPEPQKWVIAGVAIMTPLKQLNTKAVTNEQIINREDGATSTTTPTARGSKIPEKLPCPLAPRKRRPSSTSICHSNGVLREFFNPPDLESVFIFRPESERAN